MQAKKCTIKLLALAVAAVSCNFVLADEEKPYNQFESKGLVEDANVTLNMRNWYQEERSKRTGSRDLHDWSQGFNLRFESGYTQGDLGFGIDAWGLQGVKLSRDGGFGAIPNKGNGSAKKYWGRPGVAAKAAYSQTVLKYGYQSDIDLPVLSLDDGKTIPESVRGALFTTHDFEGAEINAGWFDKGSTMNEVKHSKIKKIIFLGGTVELDKNLSTSVYLSDVKDNFRKIYGNLNYGFAFSDIDKMEIDFNAYHTKYDGKNGNNFIFSIAPSYTTGAHTVMFGYQNNMKDTKYVFGPDGGGTIYLANSSYTDYEKAKERSYHLKYAIDFASLGIDGLEAAVGYIKGENIGGDKDATEREAYFEFGYTMPNGVLKDLSFNLQHFEYREAGAGKLYDNRIKIEYPFIIL